MGEEQRTAGEIRVLHVDDQPDFAELAADFLEREDDSFRVEFETGGRAALERLSEASFDCIVSDYDMPGMDGIEFLEAVRERSVETPFILFTGKGSEEVASEAISSGVTDYIQKEPGTGQYAVLANRIQNAVESERAKRAIEFERSRRSPLFEYSPDPIVEVEYSGTEAFVTTVNPAFEETFGVSESEIEGVDIIKAFSRKFSPEQTEEELESIKKQVLNGQSVIQEVSRISGGDKQEFLLRIFPFEIHENVRRAYGWYVDVSERKAAQRRFREIFDRSNEAILVMDPRKDTIKMANAAAAALLGYEQGELSEMSPAEIHPHEVERFRKFVRGVEHDGTGWTDELSCLTKRGDRIPVEISASIIDPGSSREMVAIIRDSRESLK